RIGIAATVTPAVMASAEAETPVDDDSATVAVSRQAEITTEDFVIRQIMSRMNGYEFEEFVAHVLEWGLLHYSSEWIHLTGSVSYSRRHAEAFYPTVSHVELVPLQHRAETARLAVHLV